MDDVRRMVSWLMRTGTPVRSVVCIALSAVVITSTAMAGDDAAVQDEQPRVDQQGSVAPRHTDVPAGTPRSREAATDRGGAAEKAGARVISPDLMVVSASPLSRAVVRTVDADRRVNHSIVLDGGQAQVGGMRMNTLAVRPATFRRWAPPAVASADGTWDALAHGGVSVAPSFARAAGVNTGGTYLVGGRSAAVAAVAGVHEIGIPNVGALVSESVGKRLGLSRAAAVLIDVAREDSVELIEWLHKTLAADAKVVSLRELDNTVPVSATASSQQPRSYLKLYQQASAYCPGLPWSVLAAIGEVESAHGRYNGPSSAGALGPMQFLPSTWEHYGFDGNGDGQRDVMNPFDAVPAAARYLCQYGAGNGGQSLSDAIFAYNRADWYVRKVLNVARFYSQNYGD